MKRIAAITGLVTYLLCCGPAAAEAYSGRRAILHERCLVMLAANEPYAWGKADCSMQMWRLLKDLWPELKLATWFRRTTAAAMAGWPWEPLMRLDDADFGDLLFANSEGTPVVTEADRIRREFAITHVMMSWTEPETAIHASKKRGFSKTQLRPYWWPRINLVIRPPY